MSLLKKVILVPLFFLVFLLFNEDSFAKTYQGVDQNGNPAYFEYDPTTGNSDCSDFLQVTSSDLEACQLEVGNYQNTCCTNPSGCTAADNSSINQWDYNYASGCKATQRADLTCGFGFVYQTQTCPATDTCRAEPYLYPGLCTQNGCAISSTRYKVCCNSNGTVDGNCSGGDYTGVCTSAYNVICGVSSCAGVTGNCTTLPCGISACAAFAAATPTPTPAPTPTPKKGCEGAPTWSPAKNTPTFVPGACDPTATSCTAPCSDTCTIAGKTCPATSCVSVWGCQNGTTWYNDGTYYPACPASCPGSGGTIICEAGKKGAVTCGAANSCPLP